MINAGARTATTLVEQHTAVEATADTVAVNPDDKDAVVPPDLVSVISGVFGTYVQTLGKTKSAAYNTPDKIETTAKVTPGSYLKVNPRCSDKFI